MKSRAADRPERSEADFASLDRAPAQRWPAVHALDAAGCCSMAPEKAAWHAVSDEGCAVRDIATVIG
jgi:hypothetical protein